ncbi:hypothetical protein OH76DRAFT_1485111 [Lentinus brumalis]|uniref:Uncharacterized protein n=1 Tax=Lentinus brumalis TaxID=2498619 RepID=A0A371D3I5_9APHY|nr:hypothetical protein OH76DRAFT_1485111 [Polyporus brumalis]
MRELRKVREDQKTINMNMTKILALLKKEEAPANEAIVAVKMEQGVPRSWDDIPVRASDPPVRLVDLAAQPVISSLPGSTAIPRRLVINYRSRTCRLWLISAPLASSVSSVLNAHRHMSSTSSSRLDPKTYHPSLQPAVEEAYRQGIKLTVFPGLLKRSQFATTQDAVQYLKDCSEVRRGEPCVLAKRQCIIHNGSSIRCLHCFVLETKLPCTHQTKMEKKGHASTPQCHHYKEGLEHKLITVPDSLTWESKRDQKKLKKALRDSSGRVADEPSAPTDEKGKQREDTHAAVAEWAVQVDNASSNHSGEEDVNQLAEDESPVVTKGKGKGKAKAKAKKASKASPQKKTKDGDTAILEDVRSLLQHLVKTSDEMLQNSSDLLKLKRRRYELSSDSDSESEAKRPRTDGTPTAGASNIASRGAVPENAVAGPSRNAS